MAFLFVTVVLFGVVWGYFRFNPMAHGNWYMIRRFINWFPLGMSYAFLYMARFNINASQKALNMDNQTFGLIFAAGATTYAISLVANGPVVDKIGGRIGILIATVGASVANIGLGVATYLLLNGKLPFSMALAFSFLYSLNMYFQSFGAVSTIKVKAYWFHVRERGMFGAMFGALISLGSYLAFDWGQAIVSASTNSPAESGWLHSVFQAVFNVQAGATPAIWLAYFIPAGILLVWAVLDYFLIHDTPAHAGFEEFDTHDASSGEMHVEHSFLEPLKRVFTNPILIMIALVELANGVVRNGVVQWYKPFVEQNPGYGSALFHDNWGLFLFLSGISGGYVAGHVSDKYFHSRRGPPVAISYGFLIFFLALLGATLFTSPMGLGISAVAISFLTIAIHSLMSGTAAADFGGRKSSATAAGVTDAFVYFGAAIQSFALGHLLKHGWFYWPAFLVPFSIGGILLAMKMWQSLPEATRRYLLVVEKVSVTVGVTTVEHSSLEIEEVQST